MKERTKLILSSLAIPLIWILCLNLAFILPLSHSEDYKWFVGGAVGTILILLITYLFSKLNKVSWSEIGMNWELKTPVRLLAGFVIGTAIACTMVFVIVYFTDLEMSRIEGANIPMACFWMLAIIPLAFMEEVAFRGFIFFKLEKIIGLRFTLIVTSVLFAYYHDASGATFATQLLGPGIWGIIYGVAAIWSKGLAVPTGIHIGANVVLAALGMKDDNYAIWAIDYTSEITEAAQAHTEMMGLVCQFGLLLFGVFMAEWFVRRRKKLEAGG